MDSGVHWCHRGDVYDLIRTSMHRVITHTHLRAVSVTSLLQHLCHHVTYGRQPELKSCQLQHVTCFMLMLRSGALLRRLPDTLQGL